MLGDMRMIDAYEPPYDTGAERRIGLLHEQKIIYSFRCEMCGNVARNDQGMPPLCTGPTWMDEHPPEVMTQVR